MIKRYMLRIPKNDTLQAVQERLVASVQESLRKCGLEWKGQTSLESVIHQLLGKHIAAFDTCGCSSLCEESVEPAPWNYSPSAELMSSDPTVRDNVRRYHLRVSESLDAFAGIASHVLLEAGGHGGERHSLGAVSGLLIASFRDTLGPYLFLSDLCGQASICTSATPVDPWKVSELQP